MIDIAFLKHLASVRSEDEFARTATGFAALQAYNSVKTEGFGPAACHGALERVAQDVARIDPDTGIRTALEALTQALPFWESSGAIRIGRRAVYTALLLYGQALGAEGEWQIAQSVYTLVGTDAELDGETSLAAEARHLLGRAARMCADWGTSQNAYRRAYELAMEAGEISLALRAQIGSANNLWIRGDIPGARRQLNAVARRARESCPSVLPRVTLARAAVANVAGEYERAIHIAFGLLGSLSDDDEVRYQTLVDLAAFLSDYGLPDVAATALRVVECGAAEPQVRRHARLNMFFLAVRYEDETSFARLRAALATERLTPRQQTQYALFAAQGYRRFSHLDAARGSAERAIDLANRFQLFQLVFEAEDELRQIEKVQTQPREPVSPHAGVAAPDGHVAAAAIVPVMTIPGLGGRAKLPPRIRHVAESLRGMASRRDVSGSEMMAAR
jgi:hypothetical protein